MYNHMLFSKKLIWMLAILTIALPALTHAQAPANTIGRILLQVENRGEAWYVVPNSEDRYYLRDGAAAYQALRTFGLGITNADIARIPIGLESRFTEVDDDGDGLSNKLEESLGTDPSSADTDGDGYPDKEEVLNGYSPTSTSPIQQTTDGSLQERLKGRIVLQVESVGEAWYIHPTDGRRYYMTNGDAAYNIMRYLSLGISNEHLETISTHPQSPDPTAAPSETVVDTDEETVAETDTSTTVDAPAPEEQTTARRPRARDRSDAIDDDTVLNDFVTSWPVKAATYDTSIPIDIETVIPAGESYQLTVHGTDYEFAFSSEVRGLTVTKSNVLLAPKTSGNYYTLTVTRDGAVIETIDYPLVEVGILIDNLHVSIDYTEALEAFNTLRIHQAIPAQEVSIRGNCDYFAAQGLQDECEGYLDWFENMIPAIEEGLGINIGECFSNVEFSFQDGSFAGQALPTGAIRLSASTDVTERDYSDQTYHEMMHLGQACAGMTGNHAFLYPMETELTTAMGYLVMADAQRENVDELQQLFIEDGIAPGPGRVYVGCEGALTYGMQDRYLNHANPSAFVKEYFTNARSVPNILKVDFDSNLPALPRPYFPAWVNYVKGLVDSSYWPIIDTHCDT